jgi:tetratricopeptide (TPR) repeat protein
LYLLQSKFDDAAKWAKKIVASGEADDTAKQILKAAQNKQLSDELRKRIEPPPAAATADGQTSGRAWQFMEQGRRDEAKEIYEAILVKDPKDTAALNGLGWFYLLVGNTEQAKPYFKQCLEVDPLAGGAMNGMARVLQANDDLEGAMKIWQQMVDKLPGPNAGAAGLADAYMEKGDYQKAVPLLEQLVKSDSQNQEFKNKLSQAQAEAGK